VVTDGIEAVELLQQAHGPRIAILDWLMPGINVLDIVKKVRSGQEEIPHYLIMLTSKNDKKDIVKALDAGADDFITKPFDPSELKARLDVGKRMVKIIDKIPVEDIPDVYINSEIIKIMELLDRTGYIPESWNSLLVERYLADSKGLTEVGKEILRIYRGSHPVVYLTPDILDFVRGMPKIGLYEELITYKNTKKQGDNILNALQAMRLLNVSPTTW